MLVKDRHRLKLTLVFGSGLVLLLLYVGLTGPTVTETLRDLRPGWVSSSSPSTQQTTLLHGSGSGSGSGAELIGPHGEIVGFAPPTTFRPGPDHPLHTELFSATTKDRRYFRIRFGTQEVLNPNIIPHPTADDTWIVVAQRRYDPDADLDAAAGGVRGPSIELVCDARFLGDGQLTCVGADGATPAEPRPLPIAPTAGDPARCAGDLGYFALNVGPHDARVFYGPDAPYVVYGSNSYFTCFGQWIVDLRSLQPTRAGAGGDWGPGVGVVAAGADFAAPNGTELRRPPPWAPVEKNWFLFWDADGARYAHFDLAPRRALARLGGDGGAGADLGLPGTPASPLDDDACLARRLPRLGRPELEGVHQATNSLSVTLCRRADPACAPTDDNTFVLAVFHHKTYFAFRAAYRPYVVLFRRRAPFALWAVGARPLWVAGRGVSPPSSAAAAAAGDVEMMYVTSVSWRARGQRSHGYADDVLFLAFGIEDRMAGGIDVLAGDLLANLGLC